MAGRPWTGRRAALAAVVCVVTVLTVGLAWREWGVATRGTPTLGHDALVSIDSVAYGRSDLAAHLGEEPRYANVGEARSAILGLVDRLLLERSAREIASPGETLRAEEALRRLMASADPVRPIGDAEVERYYAEHRSLYHQPARARLAWFHVAASQPPEEAQRLIRSLYIQARLDREPGDFRRLLAEQIPGASSGERIVPCEEPGAGPLPPAVVRAGCDLRPGAVSHPVETPQGFFVVRKTAALTARNRPLATARREIRETLRMRARRDAMTAMLDRLRSSAEVVIAPGAAESLVARRPAPASNTSPDPGPPRPPGHHGASS